MRISVFVACLWLVTSPLQGKIVFYSKRDENLEIYRMDSDGSNPIRLTFNEAADRWPTWSPNGQQIAFHSYRDGNAEVYVMHADGSNPRNLTRHPAFDVRPQWHPGGERIAFLRGEDIGRIYTIDLDGNNLRLVIEADFIGDLEWSPDGKWIAFEASIDQEGGEIYVVNVNGTNRGLVSRPVPRSTMRLGGWSPDGKKILYTVITAPLAHGVAHQYSMVIATLHRSKRKVIEFEPVTLPPGVLLAAQGFGWGADGKSILIGGNIGITNIYRFRLADRQLIQLTDSPATDFGAHEWNPRLPVAPRGLVPKRWGETKSNSPHHRGIGVYPVSPIP